MKFLELPSLDAINRSLSYTTPEQQVFARCELYTTKAAGLDKKLYKYLNKHLEERYLSDLALSQSISTPSPPSPTSPPYERILPGSSVPGRRGRRRSSLSPLDKREIHSHALAIQEHGGLSLPARISYGPFGPLDLVSSRRTVMYLIATLNATHPNHDFTSISPQSFRRERTPAVRHNLSHILPPTNPTVQSQFLSFLEAEMDWKPNAHNTECTVYSVDESTMMDALPVGTVWSTTLFWMNKKLKRVCFLGVEGRSITSPVLEATDEMSGWDEEEGVLGELEMEL